MKIRKILGVITISAFLFFIVSCNQNIEFTVNFDSNGGTTVSPITTDGKSTIKTPDDPTKDGFEFGGWYWDNHTFSRPFTANSLLDAPISSNMTVYAKWILDNDPPIGTISVTFVTNGGTNVPIQKVLPGSKLSIPQIQREGYTLDGWYTSLNEGETLDERWSFANNTVDNQLVLYANWIINHYTITFDSDGGSNVSAITQDYNSLITNPTDPMKTGYTFTGWDIDIPNNMPAHNMKITAQWQINQYTITFDTNGGNSIESITQDFNTTIQAPTDPMKTGYTFTGWDIDIPNNMPAHNMKITAQWQINQYTITFKNYDNTILSTQQLNYGDMPIYDEIPIIESDDYTYIFSGWDQMIVSVTADAEYVAQFSNLALKTPKNVFIDNGVLTWDAVPNASSYKVIVDEYEYITSTTSYNVSNIATYNYIAVVAIGPSNISDSNRKVFLWTENDQTYINYGKYPQTVVSNTALITTLNRLTQTNSESYYEYNGSEYAKVTASSGSSNKFINGTTIVRGQTYFFKVEPIKWRVISNSDGTLQLLSEYIIDKQAYHSSSNRYAASSIRTWLNGTFYNKAFGSLDQNGILTTLVDNSAATTHSSNNSYTSANTNDKIYLLSYQDVINTNYGFVASTNYSTTREAQTTDYARAIGASMSTGRSTYGNGYWWLRSPSSTYSSDAYLVNYNGGMGNYYVDIASIGVRPALQIK